MEKDEMKISPFSEILIKKKIKRMGESGRDKNSRRIKKRRRMEMVEEKRKEKEGKLGKSNTGEECQTFEVWTHVSFNLIFLFSSFSFYSGNLSRSLTIDFTFIFIFISYFIFHFFHLFFYFWNNLG